MQIVDNEENVLYEEEIKAGLGITPKKKALNEGPQKPVQAGKRFLPEPRQYQRIRDIKSSVLDRSHVQNSACKPDSLVSM